MRKMKINDSEKNFMMSLFLDNDHVTTVNRSILSITSLVIENMENMDDINRAIVVQNPSRQHVLKAQTEVNNHYFEQVVLKFTDEDFEATFNTKRSTVQAFISSLKTSLQSGTISLDKKVHVFLLFLMSDLSYNEVGKLFGLHKSSVSHIFQEIGSFLAENRLNYIKWPSAEEQHVTRIKVNTRYKFPNCIGFIDACRLKVGQRKSKQSTILLQAVCNESLMFTDVHIGEIGKTKKSKVFKDSPLAKTLQNIIDFDNHILGDSEYKLKINLITPFSSEEILTGEEIKFNETLWSAKSYVGHAFELLKEKFRKLNHIDMLKPEIINILIYSACVLHNFILIHEGVSEVKEETVICDDGVTLSSDIVMSAIEKRQFLCNYINYIDSDIDPIVSR